MDEVWKAALAGVSALVVGVVLWQVQQGGRRRRLRREIREELELIEMLDDSPVRERLIDRSRALLETYEPDPSTQPVLTLDGSRVGLVADVLLAAGAVLLAMGYAGTAPLKWSIPIGVAAAVVVAGVFVTRGRTPHWKVPEELSHGDSA
ncbi:hypothetical protein GGQ22_20115 [Nocardioides sp. zg-579]|uniref:Uncharacterized protein n=1 Tax=Nocardioides marmotae TaxID=2663857 RepID=A0A6I3JGB4_9ACTN|nr:hypothetical protein [Nocardioides marmotae]MCR6033718.1 hypothetical protein [Gordonia jinghuaiqii]MTB97376.1 hypothetical protein [Nocardioides marmotae]QKE01713.1 hypothetical protein HPC71_12015 [Nocardioides marmotae]